MIRIHCEQGSGAWVKARLGIPTASRFEKVITPKTMKLSESSAGYAYALIAEQILGVPMDDASSYGFMQRGAVLEKHAIKFYELQRDVDVEKLGFATTDDGRAGCSPDGLVGAVGMIEIKCPAAPNHIGYLLGDEGIGYRAQVQGQLWVMEREWVDTISYHAELPTGILRIRRDEKFITALAAAVKQFNEFIDDAKDKLLRLGYIDEGLAPAELRVS